MWTVTNAAFLPILYFFYPETGEWAVCPSCQQSSGLTQPANRTLEDLDEYYRSNPALVVTRDPDAIGTQRPWRYVQREEEELQRQRKVPREMERSKDGSAASVRHVEGKEG